MLSTMLFLSVNNIETSIVIYSDIEKMNKDISTFSRYLYINLYAFLLILLGGGILITPLYRLNPYWLALQLPFTIACIQFAYNILSKWNAKKRRYRKLMETNRETFDPLSFYEYMQAPCGRLLVKLVLTDLGMSEQYRNLKSLQEPWWKNLKGCCKRKKTVIIIKKLNHE